MVTAFGVGAPLYAVYLMRHMADKDRLSRDHAHHSTHLDLDTRNGVCEE